MRDSRLDPASPSASLGSGVERLSQTLLSRSRSLGAVLPLLTQSGRLISRVLRPLDEVGELLVGRIECEGPNREPRIEIVELVDDPVEDVV